VPQAVGAPSDIEDPIPVGAVASLSFGGGGSSDKKWRFGAAGTPEMQDRLAQTRYEVTVAMDDGEQRTFRVADASALRPGQRVTVRSGTLEPVGT